jgi:hypothetical protein
MRRYKRNQAEEAIFRTLGARDERLDELKFRLKRLMVTDRRLGRDASSGEEWKHRYAFYSQDPPGSGTEVMFSGYEVFALVAAIMLLEHGLTQASVVRLMRQVRRELEAAHAETLKKDPATLFDQQAIRAMAKPGMIATDNTHPVFLVFVRLTGSSADSRKRSAATAVGVCRGHAELGAFFSKHCVPGIGATFFEFVRLMHALAGNLLQTTAIKRGRGAA